MSVTVVSCLYGTDRRFAKFASAWWASVRELERKPDQVIVAGDRHSDIPVTVDSVVVVPCPWRHPQAYYLQQAILMAGTEWVWVLDIDDLALSNALNGIDDVQADVWAMGYQRSDGEIYIPGPLTADDVLDETNLIPAGSAFRVDAFKACGGFQDVAFQDWALWRALARSGATFESSGRAHYRYRRHPETRSVRELTADRRELHIAEMEASEGARVAA